MHRPLLLLGHFSLLLTAILAIIFYKERVFFIDPGQQLFEMINNGWFKVYVNRHSMVINQVFPLIAIKLGLPLKSIVMIYSLSFILIFYLCFLIAVYGFKNMSAGLAIAFAPLFIRLAFGHSISEAWLGIAYSAVFYAILNYYHTWKKKGIVFILLFYLFIIVILGINYFIHPITLFTVAFALGFTYFNQKEFKSPHIYIVGFLAIAPYIYKFIFPDHVHEENFFAGIKMADKLLPVIQTLAVWKFILKEFFNIYFLGLIIALFCGISYFRKKEFLSILFIVTFTLFYFIIASLAFYRDEPAYAMESRILPIIFMLVIPAVEIIRVQKKNAVYSIAILVLLAFSFTNLILQVRNVHSRRLNLYQKIMDDSMQFPEKKFYIQYPKEDKCPVNSWGSGAESLMLSSLNGKENSRTIIFIPASIELKEGLQYWPCVFLWVEWYLFFPEDQLNKKYFDLGCTPYRELPYQGDL